MTIQSSEMQADVALAQIKGLVRVSTKYRKIGFTSAKTAGVETTFAMNAEPKFREDGSRNGGEKSEDVKM
jgi:hypothetical protein